MINSIILGDCLEKLKEMSDNSVDSIVTDPPYHLVSIVKRFGKEGSAPAQFGTDGAFSRASKGFMGKRWDGVNENGIGIAQNVELWKECLRVLKPGGHLLAFSGTRTYHRMASAIEDAGFDIRDQIAWCYGQGFPKSLNVFKQLKKKCECGNMEVYENRTQQVGANSEQEAEYFMRFMQETDLSQTKSLGEKQGEVLQSQMRSETLSGTLQDNKQREEPKESSIRGEERILERGNNLQKTEGKLQGGNLPKMSTGVSTNGEEGRLHNATQISDGSTLEQITDENRGSSPHRPQSEQQQYREPCAFCKQWGTQATRTLGVGTALKPSIEPICFARKPLEKGLTIAENCLKYGTGGINIDESRVGTETISIHNAPKGTFAGGEPDRGSDTESYRESVGRFPANLIHDNSEEVRDCFPETKSNGEYKKTGDWKNTGDGEIRTWDIGYDKLNKYAGQEGNASRFFKSVIYQAKSSKSERNKGLDSIVLVDILRVWNENNTTKEEKLIRLMVTGISPKKVIGESGVQLKNANEWNTCLFGKHLMEKYQEDIKSITKTETNSITTSQILNWLIHLLTKEYTVGANLETGNGGNLVENAENSNTLIITISEAMALALGVKDVVSGTQLKINVKEGSNIHSTVKPIALMEYLIKMVTPKGGVVLDPFAGSGSTLVAAKQNGFNYIGIELTPEYIPIIEARLKNLGSTQTTLL